MGFDKSTSLEFGRSLGRAAASITPFVAALGTSVAAVGILNSAITTFYNYQQRLNKAVDEGDVSAAGDGSDILAHYTFGVGYEILDGLTTNFEYCMTPDAVAADIANNANADTRLRLSLSVSF